MMLQQFFIEFTKNHVVANYRGHICGRLDRLLGRKAGLTEV